MSIVEDPSGPSKKVVLTAKNGTCSIYLFGAHITSYEYNNKERLWMSRCSPLDGTAPIRGGVPIAFPQFADEGDLMLHGFARESLWSVESLSKTKCILNLTENERTKTIWPFRFRLLYTVELLDEGSSLLCTLNVKNCDEAPFSYTCCLHSYFLFENTSKVQILGLENADFIDKVDGRKLKNQNGKVINIEEESYRSASEAGLEKAKGYVDRIYLNTGTEFEFKESSRSLYKISISSSFADTTVYNPWTGDKQGPKFPDFDDDGYKYTICLEPTLSTRNKMTLNGGEEFTGTQTIQCIE